MSSSDIPELSPSGNELELDWSIEASLFWLGRESKKLNWLPTISVVHLSLPSYVHFKDDPVMPGCLGLDAMWQLLGFYLLWSGLPGIGRALGAEKVKFFGQVLPTSKIVRYELDIKRVVNRGAVVGLANGNMFVDDRHVYSAENLKVGLFKDTSNF